MKKFGSSVFMSTSLKLSNKEFEKKLGPGLYSFSHNKK